MSVWINDSSGLIISPGRGQMFSQPYQSVFLVETVMTRKPWKLNCGLSSSPSGVYFVIHRLLNKLLLPARHDVLTLQQLLRLALSVQCLWQWSPHITHIRDCKLWEQCEIHLGYSWANGQLQWKCHISCWSLSRNGPVCGKQSPLELPDFSSSAQCREATLPLYLISQTNKIQTCFSFGLLVASIKSCLHSVSSTSSPATSVVGSELSVGPLTVQSPGSWVWYTALREYCGRTSRDVLQCGYNQIA